MKKNNGGFSLIETVAAIAILGAFFSAACAGLLLGLRMNEKTDAMLQSQLAVSSAVEMLMHEGIDPSKIVDGKYTDTITVTDDNGTETSKDKYPDVQIIVTQAKGVVNADLHYYEVIVETKSGVTVTETIEDQDEATEVFKPDISVTTHIRKAVTES